MASLEEQLAQRIVKLPREIRDMVSLAGIALTVLMERLYSTILTLSISDYLRHRIDRASSNDRCICRRFLSVRLGILDRCEDFQGVVSDGSRFRADLLGVA